MHEHLLCVVNENITEQVTKKVQLKNSELKLRNHRFFMNQRQNNSLIEILSSQVIVSIIHHILTTKTNLNNFLIISPLFHLIRTLTKNIYLHNFTKKHTYKLIFLVQIPKTAYLIFPNKFSALFDSFVHLLLLKKCSW